MPSKSAESHSASRVIMASPLAIYQAFVDPVALISWLPPQGMSGRVEVFEPREGGSYRIALAHIASEDSARGKTSDMVDVTIGRFLELVPGNRIVQSVDFVSDDPAFAGTMTMTWIMRPVRNGGTQVTIVADNVPTGIQRDEHEAGMASSLANLAAFTE